MRLHLSGVRLAAFILVLAVSTTPVWAQGVPGPPRNLTATASGFTLTVSWQPPATGGAVAGYVLEIGTSPGTFDVGSLPLGDVLTISFPAPPGVFYFRVHAENAAGSGPPSAEVAVAIGGALPGAPRNPTAVATAGDGLALSWDPPLTGAPITGYVLEVSMPSGSGSLPIGPVTSWTVATGVPPGTYAFRVSAVNAAGQGPPSAIASVTVGAATLPSAPLNLQANVSGSLLSLTWDAPVAGAPITGYVLEAAVPGGGPFPYVLPLGPVTSFRTPVPPGVLSLRVAAVNGRGQGPFTPVVTVTVTAGAVPSVPQNFAASVVGNTLTLSWNAPASGAPITDYVLEYLAAGAVFPGQVSLGPVRSLTVPIGNGQYGFRLSAVNAQGTGPATPLLLVTVGASATEPRSVTGSGANHTLSVTWQDPAVGLPFDGYVMQIGTLPDDYGFFDGPVGAVNSVATPIGDGTYFVRVAATNALGLGLFSAPIAVTVGPPCAVPVAPVLSGSRTGNIVTLSWTTPPGVAPTGYSLQLGSGTQLDRFRSTAAGAVTSVAGPVAPGTYRVRVVGTVACGAGAPSNVVTITVP